MSRAISAYQGLLRQTDDERVKSRAHYGLARIFELQNQLDKAKEEYKLVTGGFATAAAERIKELDKKDVQDTFTWLATAEGPRRSSPVGPGIPGQQPQFTPGEIDLPAAKTPAEDSSPAISVDDLFEGIGTATTPNQIEGVDRYNEAAPSTDLPASETPPAKGAAESAADAAKPQE
jgi:hypothetical protein